MENKHANEKYQIFDSLTCHLESKNLIEASAGTGKTYNIQNLYARLILEKKLDIASILVVTFTEAATKELKDRLRNILTDIKIFMESDITNDSRIKAVAGDKSSFQEKIDILNKAINNFDSASIFTIHGFCKKILSENAFKCSLPFNFRLETDTKSFVNEILMDFFRKNYYAGDEVLLSILNSSKFELKNLLLFVNNVINDNENVRIIPPEIETLDKFITNLKQLNALCNSDVSQKLYTFINKMISENALKISFQKKFEVDWETFTSKSEVSGRNYFSIYEKCHNFTKLKMLENCYTKKRNVFENSFPDELSEFTLLCDEISNFSLEKNLNNILKIECKNYFLEKYKHFKNSLNFLTFNDLVAKTERFLTENKDFLSKVQSEYNAGLIDEFQDTDPLQYNIFQKIFANESKTLFLVGDPKQAIYGFRGGDIYTYRHVKRELIQISEQNNQPQIFTLSTNFRSSPEIIDSVNSIFSRNNSFIDKEINFYNSKSISKDEKLLLNETTSDCKPIKLVYFQDGFNADTMFKEIAKETLIEVLKILNNEAAFIVASGVRRRILPGDLAILITENNDANSIKNLFLKHGIPAVTRSQESVFDSAEAESMKVIFFAILSNGNINLIKAALTTTLFSYPASNIFNFSHKIELEDEKTRIVDFFKNLYHIWKEKSFIEMFTLLISHKNYKHNLLNSTGGVRSYTNIMHISELMHNAELKKKSTPHALFRWFCKQINADTREMNNSSELRLETDNDAVQIMTIHKSKGLEFPIVFCPTIWKFKSKSKNVSYVKSHNENHEIIYDISPGEEQIGLHEDDELAEKMRLFYVALTRAKYRCYLHWGKFTKRSEAWTSPLDYIFAGDDKLYAENFGCITKLLDKISRENGENDCIPNLGNFVELIKKNKNDEKVNTVYSSNNSKTTPRNVRHFNAARIKSNWKVTSFSSILPHKNNFISLEKLHSIEKDYDQSDSQTNEESTKNNQKTIFDFPGGPNTGTCWHEIFEQIDFQDTIETISNVVKEKLLKYGLLQNIDETEQNNRLQIAINMVERVINYKFNEVDQFSLKSIPISDRLNEMEFHFSLNDSDIPLFTEIINEYAKSIGIDKSTISEIKSISGGFMCGFIDLIFRYNGKYYIIDWKSNKINGSSSDFTRHGMLAEISKNFYHAQYLIYSIALIKFLKLHIKNFDYDKDFGGVYYLFLRGINKNGNGIFYEKPSKKLIIQLENSLCV